MTSKSLKRICFLTCLLCIILDLAFSLLMIWTDVNPELTWKFWSTSSAFFVASLFTLIVTKLIPEF